MQYWLHYSPSGMCCAASILHCTAKTLHCTVVNYITLYCNVLYCTLLRPYSTYSTYSTLLTHYYYHFTGLTLLTYYSTYCTVLFCTIQHYTMYCWSLHWPRNTSALHSVVQLEVHCIVLCWPSTKLYTTLHYTTLHCTTVHCPIHSAAFH